MAKQKEDLIGKKFGRLTVIGEGEDYVSPKLNRKKRYLCLCECGKTSNVSRYDLIHGNVKSCGCLQRDIVSKIATKHQKSKHPLYKTWHNMRCRCKNPNATKYEIYGGKNIKVCEEWDKDFMSFFNWAIENGWEKGLTIDRIDGNGDYRPENCRWADYYKQNNNLKSNHILEYKGEKHSVYQWSHILNINPKTLTERIRRGWTTERALETPVIPRKRG